MSNEINAGVVRIVDISLSYEDRLREDNEWYTSLGHLNA